MQAQNELKASVGLVLWTLAWAASLALAKFGPRLLWDPPQQVASWVAVAVNLAVGIGWIVAFTRFLHALDELQRKIMQDALAVTLGVGWVVGFAYVVADAVGLVARDVNVAVLPALMGVVFMVAFAVGKLRYR
ncbi:hypothetical protein [Catellatospora sichuanensis]|uniref:hypothetical protein n=1 Tax=Catellatospora sichuanensis TaxID=1969805 RepID=UPI001184644B|nr:hypothetical protein [Catellatospora sichuanensis]